MTDIVAIVFGFFAVSLSIYFYIRYRRLHSKLVDNQEDLSRTKLLIKSFLSSSSEDRNLYALNRKMEYIYFNEQHKVDMQRVFSAEPEIGANKIELLPEPLSSQYETLYLRALTGESYSHTQKFGEQYITFLFSPIKEGKEVSGITVQAFQTTEQILLEQELERHQDDLEELVINRTEEIVKQRNFFQTIIDEDPNFIFVRDNNGNYLLANKSTAKAYNKKVDEVIGSNLFDLADNSAQAEKYLSEDQNIISSGKDFFTERSYVLANNEKKWFLVKKKRIKFNENQFVLGVLSDISGLKETEENLQSAYDKLSRTLTDLQEMQLKLVASEKIASVGLLTSALIHEVNNPINYVAGNVEPLRRDFNDIRQWLELSDYFTGNKDRRAEFETASREVDELLDGIENGADRVIKLIANLKKLSYRGDGKKEFCDINEYIRSTIRLIEPIVKRKIEIEETYEDGLEQIFVEASQLNQILLNTLDLVVNKTKKSGKILIRTSGDHRKNIVEIESRGTEIAGLDMMNLIDPFDKEGDDSGLGLAVSYRIITGMGGQIVMDKNGSDSILFRITLPTK